MRFSRLFWCQNLNKTLFRLLLALCFSLLNKRRNNCFCFGCENQLTKLHALIVIVLWQQTDISHYKTLLI